MNVFLIFKKVATTHSFYLLEFILGNLNVFLQGVVAIFIGLYINAQASLYTSNQLLIYYLFGVGIINVFQRNNPIKRFEKEIETGNIAVQLTKPVSLIYFRLLRDASSKTYQVLINFIFFYLLFFVMFQGPILSPFIILRAIIMVPLAVLYYYFAIAIFMYFAILFEKSDNIARIYAMSAFFIGGGLVPASFFPKIVEYLPQYYVFGGPLHFIATGVLSHVFIHILYFIGMFLLMHLCRIFAMKKLEVNGG